MIELEKCKDDLRHCYRNRINQKKSTRWPSELGAPTLYVDVTVVRAKILPERFREEHAMGLVKRGDYSYVTVDELLRDGYGKINLIEGGPGAGKTTFTFQMCKEWAEGKLLMEDLVFWIPLRHYKSVTTTSELFDKLGYPEMMGYAQQYSGKGLVLILDGWDELPNHLQTASLFRDIIFGTIRAFTHSTIIVTSRPMCSGQIAEAVKETNSYYQILGFNQELAVTYINAYFYSDLSSAKLLLDFLHSNKYLHQHFYIPISVTIMCFVYHSDGEHIPQTLCQLYERFVVLCLRSHIPNVCLQDLANFKTIHTIPPKMKPVFVKLCNLAFGMLKANKLVLYEEELEVIQDDLDSLQLKQFDGFGLLHVDHYTSSLATIVTCYSFIHRAVQELLAAISILFTDNINVMLDEHLSEGSYLLCVFPFLFSLVSKEILIPLADKLIQIFNRSDRSDRLFSSILHCLFEAHDETLCCEFGQVFSEERNITVRLRTFLDWHYACYFISVCGIKRLNVTIVDQTLVTSCDTQSEILCKYLQNTSTDIASFRYVNGTFIALSNKSTEQIAKTLSVHHNLLSLELTGVNCVPGCIMILCDSICEHNPHITKLQLPRGESGKNDLESIGFLLTTCLSLKWLRMDCSPSEGMCLNLSPSFCKAFCKTKSLQELSLPYLSLSQDDSKMFGKIISQNCSLKELHINVATADFLDAILNGLSSNTSITTFRAWSSKIGTSKRLGPCLMKCFDLNHSLNKADFTFAYISSSYVSWSSTQVSFICTGLCTNTTMVTLDISGCYIDAKACHSVCDMLSQNTALKHLFLNPVHLEKQEAIAMMDSCRNNGDLKLLALVQWPPKEWYGDIKGKDSFQYLHDPEITHIVQQLQPDLNVCWLANVHCKLVCCYLILCMYIGNIVSMKKSRNRYCLLCGHYKYNFYVYSRLYAISNKYPVSYIMVLVGISMFE